MKRARLRGSQPSVIEPLLRPTFAERLMELAVSAVGSPRFVELNLLWIGGWFIVNFGLVPGITPFDPFPFKLLMLILPVEALLLVLLTSLNGFRLRRTANRLEQIEGLIEIEEGANIKSCKGVARKP